jgi:hypothetical protein
LKTDSKPAVTGNHLATVAKVLERLGWLEDVLIRLSESTAAALRAPHLQRRWPTAVGDEITSAIFSAKGESGLATFTEELLDNGITRVLMPVIKVALALGGMTPNSLLSRLTSLSAYSFTSITPTWTPTGPTQGTVRITYLEPCSPHTVLQMTIVMRWIFKTTAVKGEVRRAERAHNGLSVNIDISWTR